ncbi:MAG: hypothetical protein MJ237_03395 [bacterium]|nr:hypothetical protein [bacterium]
MSDIAVSYTNSTAVTAPKEASQTQKNIPIGGNGTTVSSEEIVTEVKISPEVKLKNKFNNILKKLGLSPNSFDYEWLKNLTGVSVTRLLNWKEEDVDKLVEALSATIDKILSETGKTPDDLQNILSSERNSDLRKDDELIKKIRHCTIDYNIALHSGWNSVEEFQKDQEENPDGLFATLTKEYNLEEDFFKSNSPEKIAETIKNYFVQKYETLQKDVQSGKITREEAIGKQAREFCLMLANSSDEEKLLFMEIIKTLMPENKCNALKHTSDSFEDDEKRTEFHNNIDMEDIKDLAKEDITGAKISDEELSVLITDAVKYKDKKSVEDFVEESKTDFGKFLKDNAEIIARARKKKENNEELTEEETKVLEIISDFYSPLLSGELVGIIDNTRIADKDKDAILRNISDYIIDKPNYREILEKINRIATKHPEILDTDPDTLNTILNKITYGNYQTVCNDLGNGTVTDLTTGQSNTNRSYTEWGANEQYYSNNNELYYHTPNVEEFLNLPPEQQEPLPQITYNKNSNNCCSKEEEKCSFIKKMINDMKKGEDKAKKDAFKLFCKLPKTMKEYIAPFLPKNFSIEAVINREVSPTSKLLAMLGHDTSKKLKEKIQQSTKK